MCDATAATCFLSVGEKFSMLYPATVIPEQLPSLFRLVAPETAGDKEEMTVSFVRGWIW